MDVEVRQVRQRRLDDRRHTNVDRADAEADE
jgi:hypothetical protein